MFTEPWPEGPTLHRDTQPALAAVSWFPSQPPQLARLDHVWAVTARPHSDREHAGPTLPSAPTSLEAHSEVAGESQTCAGASEPPVLEPPTAAPDAE